MPVVQLPSSRLSSALGPLSSLPSSSVALCGTALCCWCPAPTAPTSTAELRHCARRTVYAFVATASSYMPGDPSDHTFAKPVRGKTYGYSKYAAIGA